MQEFSQSAREKAERYLSQCREYTNPDEGERLIADWTTKRTEAENVVGDFKRRAGEVAGKLILDVGCGNGTFMAAFARASAEVSGLEVNQTLVDIAKDTLKDEDVRGEVFFYDGITFPFPNNSFDYAFSVSTLEHVSDPRRILSEIHRVLKPGGKLYLAFPNRWRPLETHTGVLFLSYVPRSLAHFILQTFWRRNSVDELNLHFLSYWSLKRFLHGIPLQILPEYDATTGIRSLIKRILGFFGIHFSAILGTVMVVLEKRK